MNAAARFAPHALLLAAMAGMAALAPATWRMRSESPLLGAPPAEAAIAALGLGDGQAYFRAMTVRLFHAGDFGGRVAPLRAFDMDDVAAWLRHLDAADPVSEVQPNLAAYYFGLTPRTDDLRPIIDYLVDRAATAPQGGWRWLAHATYLARHRLKDPELGLALAVRLAKLPDAAKPGWTRDLPVVLLAAEGGREDDLLFLETMLAADGSLSEAARGALRNVLRTSAQDHHLTTTSQPIGEAK